MLTAKSRILAGLTCALCFLVIRSEASASDQEFECDGECEETESGCPNWLTHIATQITWVTHEGSGGHSPGTYMCYTSGGSETYVYHVRCDNAIGGIYLGHTNDPADDECAHGGS
jgi:hypothetical protein